MLHCDGLFLLSDPRLLPSAKTNIHEKNRHNIGIAALAQFCPGLQTFHAVGCFQLNVAVQKYLSALKHLKELNLSGCNRIRPASFISLAFGCHLLEHLNLSDCGEGVSDDVVQAFGSCCRGLKVLSLARCTGFQSIAALKMCSKLERLDLSGCKGISDSSLLPICDENAVPLLAHLVLNDVGSITDQSIAWIAFGCSRIVLLSMKGTKVNGYTAKALKDSFPCSTLLRNKNFFGFWPLHRYEDRQLIHSYTMMKKGITKLQALFRSLRARSHCHTLRRMQSAHRASEKIQCCWRQCLAKKVLKNLREEDLRLQLAAVKITSLFRMLLARRIANQYRRQNLMRLRNRMAVRIQVQWRVLRDWRTRMAMLEKRRKTAAARVSAAIMIQSCLRQHFAKAKVARVKHIKRARQQLRLNKAIIIGRYYRGYMARSRIQDLLQRRRHVENLKLELARKLFRVVRMRRLWHEIARRASIRRRQHKCAIRIQACARSFLARLLVAEIRTELHENLLESSVIKIQGRWKIKRAMKLLSDLRNEVVEMYKKKAWASTQLAKYWRGRKAKIFVRELRKAAEEAELWRIQVILWAAVKIQAVYRGYQGRKRFAALLREKRGLWVELFDEEKQKRFFYSKLTNEIRWQIPGDLLALIPRPVCDNCAFYEGICECSDCGEIFCQQCFDQVHYGGKRKSHEFRCLYDYYGNRIDYGDGIFPSKWPTEIVQDEVQGWMLRVAPIRSPTNVYGSWEVYDSEVLSDSGSVEIRRFYFNRDTFEASYDTPPILGSLLDLNTSGALSIETAASSGAVVPYDDSTSAVELAQYDDTQSSDATDEYYAVYAPDS